MTDTPRRDTAPQTTRPGDSETSGTRQDVLEIRGLTKVYDDGTLAVDDVDFSVAAGDFCVLIGPSGCGKSTTLHSIIGKVEPTAGEIVLDGTPITDVPTYQRDVGLVFQDFQLFPHLSVEENVRYGLERMGADPSTSDDRVEDVLELMQLTAVRDSSPESLSAGQKQRVALARSLVLEPKLLLLDEPLGDLDYKMQKRMERELLRIHRELDTTFVYVTHDQSQAMRLADQIVVMNDGQIEQSGSVSAVYNRPATAFVAAFVGDSNIVVGTVTTASSDDVTVDVETAYGQFTVSARTVAADLDSLVDQELPFVVRPQALGLDADGDNTLTCSVVDVIQQPSRGTRLVLEATGTDGQAMEVQAKVPERVTVDADAVTVGWDAEDALLLERTSVVPDVNLQKDVLGE